MVNFDLWRQFHRDWRAIDIEWRGGSPASWRAPTVTVGDAQTDGVLEGIELGIAAARRALRDELRYRAPLYAGSYLIPV